MVCRISAAVAGLVCLLVGSEAFLPASRSPTLPCIRLSSAVSAEEDVTFDPKEVVKLFGRLAEKYIMLDDSGGMCCFSACTDCEFRLPGGGYKMADQSAARPKWIPVYEYRAFESQGKEHKSKWSSDIFCDAPSVGKEEFVSKVVNDLSYAPCLGGPYLAASSAQIEDTAVVEKLFDVLADGKEKLTKKGMGVQMREFAAGEEGLNWAAFLAAFSA